MPPARRRDDGSCDSEHAWHLGVVKEAEEPRDGEGGEDDCLGERLEDRRRALAPVEAEKAGENGREREQCKQRYEAEEGQRAFEDEDAFEEHADKVAKAWWVE